MKQKPKLLIGVFVFIALIAIGLSGVAFFGAKDCTTLNLLAVDAVTGFEIEEGRVFRFGQGVGEELHVWETEDFRVCVQGEGIIYWQARAEGYVSSDWMSVELGKRSEIVYLMVELVPVGAVPGVS